MANASPSELGVALRAETARTNVRKRYVVICWTTTTPRAVTRYRGDSKRAAVKIAKRWYPGGASRGSVAWDRRAQRIVLNTLAWEIARRWAVQVTSNA